MTCNFKISHWEHALENTLSEKTAGITLIPLAGNELFTSYVTEIYAGTHAAVHSPSEKIKIYQIMLGKGFMKTGFLLTDQSVNWNQYLEVKTGDFVTIQPGVVHQLENHSSERLVVIITCPPTTLDHKDIVIEETSKIHINSEPSQSEQTNLDIIRKKDHIEINIKENVQSGLKTGFERIQFVHEALPELDYKNIDITTTFLDKKLQAPLLISSMTGGTSRAKEINYRLAKVAQQKGIAMGLGSMRVLLKEPDMLKTFSVRHIAPDIFLLANLGAVQLNYGVTPKECQQLVDAVQANALILHLNVLQELAQPEGDRNWHHLLPKIKEVIDYLSVPVIVKEIGYGLSETAAKDLIKIGVKALDIAGSGGTSWSQVESYRSTNSLQNRIAKSFINWGIPTVDSLNMVQNIVDNVPIIASGGIKSGIDGAKAIRLGASIFGIGGHFLKTADISEKDLSDEIELVIEQLKITMLCTASQDLNHLTNAKIIKIAQ